MGNNTSNSVDSSDGFYESKKKLSPIQVGKN